MARLELSVDVVAKGVEESARKISQTLSKAMEEPKKQMEEFTEGVRAGLFGRVTQTMEEFKEAQVMARRKGIAGALGEATGTVALLGIASMGIQNILDMLKGLSPVFRKMLNTITKLVELIGRPFADLLATALYPLVVLLRPIALFFRTLIRPYIQKAMETMRKGELAFAAGEYGIATQYFGIGVMWITKGITDAFISALTEAVAGIIEFIPGLGKPVADAIRGAKENILRGINDFIIGLETNVDVEFVRNLAEDFNEAVSNLDFDKAEQIVNVLESLSSTLKSEQETIERMNLSENVKKQVSGTLQNITNAIDSFVSDVEIEIENLKTATSIFTPESPENPFVAVRESSYQFAASMYLLAEDMKNRAGELLSKIQTLKDKAKKLVDEIENLKESQERASQLFKEAFELGAVFALPQPAIGGYLAGKLLTGGFQSIVQVFVDGKKVVDETLEEGVRKFYI